MASLNLFSIKMLIDFRNQFSIEDHIMVDEIVIKIKWDYIEPESYYL